VIKPVHLLAAAALLLIAPSAIAADKPNILVIWGDDIGMWNISAYHRGMMGGSTPNIDRIANDGMIFMDHYAQASCTAGRAAFITGQYPIRTGLSTVGLPGAPIGLQKEDPTLAEFLKPLGYATGQFGKNHLGDLDEHLPTAHGFDEFYGILYHLNAGEYVEQYDFPKDPEVARRFAQRGVIHSWANPDGTQRIEDKGPFGQERQRTLDEEVLQESKRFITDAVKAGKPFFVWHNTTRMHAYTQIKDEIRGQAGLWQSKYHDAMIEHDQTIGQLLDKLDDLGIADNTIVVYSSDNGPHRNTMPDCGTTPFRSEKNTNWEGAFRVPTLLRWPGMVEPGSICNEIVSHHDWLPTLLNAAGEPDVVEKLKKGYEANGKTYRVHVDGYDLVPYLSGDAEEHSRPGFFYFSDDGDLLAVRWNNWKIVFMEQQAKGTMDVWANPFTTLRVPKRFNLRTDPYEYADITSNNFWGNMLEYEWILAPVQGIVGEFLQTFAEFPPRMKAASFTIGDALEKLQPNTGLH
jgi:arylsulfatase